MDTMDSVVTQDRSRWEAGSIDMHSNDRARGPSGTDRTATAIADKTPTAIGANNTSERTEEDMGKRGEDVEHINVVNHSDDAAGDECSDDDCLLLFCESPEDRQTEAHEADCRRAYVDACGAGVPIFLTGARARAGKGWAWLLAAASGEPKPGEIAVGRIDYGPHRFFVGDVDARGLPDGYGAMVETRSAACGPASSAICEKGAAPRNATRSWPAPWDLAKWHEGFWRAGQRQGEGVNVCLDYKVAMEGHWRDDLFDGHGVRVYGRGRWTLLPDGSGNGRWSGGDLWRYCGHWRGGERHGTGVLTVAGRARPSTGIWIRGNVTGDAREPTHASSHGA